MAEANDENATVQKALRDDGFKDVEEGAAQKDQANGAADATIPRPVVRAAALCKETKLLYEQLFELLDAYDDGVIQQGKELLIEVQVLFPDLLSTSHSVSQC